jgi:hypothetical protein
MIIGSRGKMTTTTINWITILADDLTGLVVMFSLPSKLI